MNKKQKSFIENSLRAKLAILLSPFVKRDGKWHKMNLSVWVYGSKELKRRDK